MSLNCRGAVLDFRRGFQLPDWALAPHPFPSYMRLTFLDIVRR